MSLPKLSNVSADYLEALADELAIPESRYLQAQNRYNTIGKWLQRPTSTIAEYKPNIYVQGSFRLGTAIRPLNESEEYDIDAVCAFELLDRDDITQAELKKKVGYELEQYKNTQNIKKPLSEGRRCWTLHYADDAKFHMDVLPALEQDDSEYRLLLEKQDLDTNWLNTSISITYRNHPYFNEISDEWPRSNPKGYSSWFISKMNTEFLRKKRAIFENRSSIDAYNSVEDVPDYKIRTPLQSAIMILKRHRDNLFVDNPDDKPISIIISTLAAHSYNNEQSVGEALFQILLKMQNFIEKRGEQYIIRNPTDPLENFADKWLENPNKKAAFFDWHHQCTEDFSSFTEFTNLQSITDILAPRVGEVLVEKSIQRLHKQNSTLRSAVTTTATNLSFPNTARSPEKPRGFA